MQARYPARFVREMGCTPAELCGWLPGASRGAAIAWTPSPGEPQSAIVPLEAGAQLQLRWTVLPPRRIALVTLPRLEVLFDFGQTDADVRHHFMRHFDLYTQRGGG